MNMWSNAFVDNFAFSLFLFLLWNIVTLASADSIDQIITAAANSSDRFGLLQSENGGDVLVELDMLLTRDQWRSALLGSRYRGKRKAIRSTRYRWTDNTIPYEFTNGAFSFYEQGVVRSALAEWEKHTCVTFRPARSSDRNRISFQNGGGCASFVGMVGGSQAISLGRGCRVKKVVVHEVGHAVGFQHEQTRPDRDSYVTIQTENIPPNLLYNFQKYPVSFVNDYGVPYDYGSVMHYSSKAFSINGRPTIVARDRRFQDVMGSATGLSFRDVKLANLMYNCATQCGQKTCPGDGFVGKDCQCYCPGDPTTLCSDSEGTFTTKPTVTARTTTPPPVTKCFDANVQCRFWSSRGECNRNKGFMMFYCKKSCNFCKDTKEKDKCEDLNDNCAYWARRNFCNNNLYKTYLRNNCPRSCKVCSGTNLVSTGENDLTSKNKHSDRGTVNADCRDNLSLCGKWSKLGYCKRNSSYMRRSCRKSCNIC